MDQVVLGKEGWKKLPPPNKKCIREAAKDLRLFTNYPKTRINVDSSSSLLQGDKHEVPSAVVLPRLETTLGKLRQENKGTVRSSSSSTQLTL